MKQFQILVLGIHGLLVKVVKNYDHVVTVKGTGSETTAVIVKIEEVDINETNGKNLVKQKIILQILGVFARTRFQHMVHTGPNQKSRQQRIAGLKQPKDKRKNI